MRLDKYTIKAQEAIQDGQSIARRSGHPHYEPEHLSRALLDQEEGIIQPILQRIGADPRLISDRVDEALSKLPRVEGTEGGVRSQRLVKLFDRAEDEAKSLKDEYVSSEHVLLALAKDKGPIGEILKSSGVTHERILAVLKDVRGGRDLPGPRKVRKRSDPGREGRETRSGDRPGRGNSARHPGPLAPHQEQPGADRRSRGRKDGDCRRPGQPDYRWGCTRGSEKQTVDRARSGRDGSGSQIPRGIRGATQGGAEGNRRRAGRADPLHRRAAHTGGGGQGRGSDGCGEHAQACVGAR